MVCEQCQGKGFIYQIPKKWIADGASASDICSMCNGSGISHCCEGDQEQPEPDLIGMRMAEALNGTGDEYATISDMALRAKTQ